MCDFSGPGGVLGALRAGSHLLPHQRQTPPHTPAFLHPLLSRLLPVPQTLGPSPRPCPVLLAGGLCQGHRNDRGARLFSAFPHPRSKPAFSARVLPSLSVLGSGACPPRPPRWSSTPTPHPFLLRASGCQVGPDGGAHPAAF